ncbi:hypothetical protein SBA4_1560002 [Candidatus Sulfopaludibacter sp. SbA4]|nr:hypothetical protein SBA4_1560002 [Candidatus Sulfopaludibacter sp. SbA4]
MIINFLQATSFLAWTCDFSSHKRTNFIFRRLLLILKPLTRTLPPLPAQPPHICLLPLNQERNCAHRRKPVGNGRRRTDASPLGGAGGSATAPREKTRKTVIILTAEFA